MNIYILYTHVRAPVRYCVRAREVFRNRYRRRTTPIGSRSGDGKQYDYNFYIYMYS